MVPACGLWVVTVPRYMLRGVWVRFDDFNAAPMADYLHDANCLTVEGIDAEETSAAVSGLSGSLVFIQLEKADFKLRVHLPDGSYDYINVVRWQFPLTHAMVRTAMSSQGRTFAKGVLADLRRNGGMTNDIWWLNVYVILSRATRMDFLLLIGLDEKVKTLLENGPPDYVREKIRQLHSKAADFEATVEALAGSFGMALPHR